jgi:ankyrin repeat protein
MLLRRGIFVDAKSNYNRTPLHLASEVGRVEILRLLLQHGADTHAHEI